jgi:hypothetical protein
MSTSRMPRNSRSMPDSTRSSCLCQAHIPLTLTPVEPHVKRNRAGSHAPAVELHAGYHLVHSRQGRRNTPKPPRCPITDKGGTIVLLVGTKVVVEGGGGTSGGGARTVGAASDRAAAPRDPPQRSPWQDYRRRRRARHSGAATCTWLHCVNATLAARASTAPGCVLRHGLRQRVGRDGNAG